jgi:hypothetical protein
VVASSAATPTSCVVRPDRGATCLVY